MLTASRAVDVGTYVAERVWEQPRRLREREELERAARDAYRTAGGVSPTGGQWLWSRHRVTWLRADVVVKVARLEYGEFTLRRERDLLTRISQDPRAAQWSGTVPAEVWTGIHNGRFVAVQERKAGLPLAELAHERAMRDLVAEKIQEIHATTARPVVADDVRLMRWLLGPARNVADLLRRWGRGDLAGAVTGWAYATADRLRCQECRVALVHGDMWPGNVLLHRGAVTGVIDWDQGAYDDAALHDLLHLDLYTEARERRSDLGVLVREALLDRGTGGREGSTSRLPNAGAIRRGCEDLGLGAEDALAWYWLRHTSRMSLEPGHATNPRWVARNVVAVASALEDRNKS